MKRFKEILLLLMFFKAIDGNSSIDNSPTSSIHENYDDALAIWTVSATCRVEWTCPTTCYRRESYSCGWWDWSTCYNSQSYTCYTTCSGHRSCDRCQINSQSPASIFEIQGALTVVKKACSDPGCEPCDNGQNCLNAGEQHTFTIECWRAADTLTNRGNIKGTYSISISANDPPTFTYASGDSINVYKSSAGAGTQINEVLAIDSDLSIGGDAIQYRKSVSPNASWIHNNILFDFNPASHVIYVTKSLQYEFSYTFQMAVCIKDRRSSEYCRTLDITLYACYQTPNCTDQQITNLWDTHGISPHSSNDSLFQMIYPQPTYHFPNFRSTWQKLSWALADGGLTESTIDVDTGEIYLTTNISIFPSWPSKSFTQTVTVSNSESCYTTTCQMDITVWYKNWPIEIRSLPASGSLHEDTDDERLIHTLVVYDYNYYWEDNVTCHIKHVYDIWGENDMELFELKHNGQHSWNSYSLYKRECQYRECGYKRQNYTCPKHSGCMTHNVTQSYNVLIHCKDGYDSTDERNFTFNVVKNEVPIWRNLPMHIDVEAPSASQHDIIFSIMYTDAENENLTYEYAYKEQVTNLDPGYFFGSPSGNFYDNLGNITLTTYLWDKPTNSTYSIWICGHERRNEICEYLTIDLEEYCSTTPQCSGTIPAVHITEETSVGTELIDTATYVTDAASFLSLRYSISSSRSDLFDINESTGKVTTLSVLPPGLYHINIFVYNTGACSYSHCTVTVNVSDVNYPTVITNLPHTVSISEDEQRSTTLYILSTSDQDAGDDVTCSVASTDSYPFYVKTTFSGSGVYVVAVDNPYLHLSSSRLEYAVVIQCVDSQNAGENKTLTINVIPNAAPTLNNLKSPGPHTVDQSVVFNGTTIFTEQGLDNENDDLTYNCSVDSTWIPLECVAAGNLLYIQLRRNVSVEDENNAVYSISVSVSDAKHVNSDQATLTVTFTSTHATPYIDNLPSTVTFAEDSALGTTLFVVNVIDTDLPRENHFITMVTSSDEYFLFIPATGVLTLAKAFDFEAITSFTLRFKVRDDFLDNPEWKYLRIDITNVNEGNTLSASVNTMTFSETTPVGTTFDFGLTCTDVDVNDVLRFSMASADHADYFSINERTGIVTLLRQWDLDSGASLSDQSMMTIQCADASGQSSSVPVLFQVERVNNHRPTVSCAAVTNCDTTPPKLNLNRDTPLTGRLLEVSASDDDTGDDNVFTFSILGAGVGSQYFEMVALPTRKRSVTSNSAYLRLRRSLDFSNDKIFQFTIKVSDGEASQQFTGITLEVNYTAGDPVIRTADGGSGSFPRTAGEKTILGVLITEIIIVLGLGVHFAYNVCPCCKRKTQSKRNVFVGDTSHNIAFRLPKKFGSKADESARTPASNAASKTVTKRTVLASGGGQAQARKVTKSRTSTRSFDSSSDSSSSSDSEIETITIQRKRAEVRNTSFQPVYTSQLAPSSGLPAPLYVSQGLPPPVYSSRANTQTSRL